MPSPFVIEERVRWSDVDAAGIIFYGSYVRFFELAETELFRSAGLSYATVFDRFDMYLPRARIVTQFHYPARLDDTLGVAAYIGRVGRSSITMNFDVAHLPTGQLAADGHLVLVCADRSSLESKPLPAEFVSALEPYTLSVPEARAQLHVSVPPRAAVSS